MSVRFFAHISLVFSLLLLGGCAGHRAFSKGETLARQGDYDAAVVQLVRAVKENPERHEFAVRLKDARVQAARQHIEAGRNLVEKGMYRVALAEFEQANALDPTNETGLQESKKAHARLRAQELVDKGAQFHRERKFAQARDALTEALLLVPGDAAAQELLNQIQGGSTILDGFELDTTSDKPITLKFKDTEIRDVFNIVTKLSGINFLFDDDIKPQKISIFLENATFAQALEVLLRLNSLDKKVLNAKTILIYPQKKEIEKKYEDQIIQTFYLSNIDAKKAVNLLRTLLQLRKIYVHEELNALVIRDTPEVIKLAQQILEAADRADSEVIFELELVEIAHTDNFNFGPRLSAYSTTLGLAEAGQEAINATITTNSLSDLKFLYTIPSVNFTMQKTRSDSEILANPKVRVKNKEKAKIHIGSREPIVTTTTSANDVTSANIQYVDVGVKLDVEPTIQLDHTVVTKIGLEVSSVSDRKAITGGGEALTIGTTNAQTVLILKDGEQTIIGGLIRDDFTKGRDTIPFIGELPLIGSLFSGHKRDKTKREILLSITPHIVKNIEMPRPDVSTIWSGGEEDMEAGARFGSFAKPLEPVATMAPPSVAPAVRPPDSAPLPAPMQGVPQEPIAPVKDVLPGPPATGPAPAGQEKPPVDDEVPPSPGPMFKEALAAPVNTVAAETAAASADLATSPAVAVVSLPGEPKPLELKAKPSAGKILLKNPEKVVAGEEVAVMVNVSQVRNLYSAPLFVTYDAQRFEFVRVQEGEFLKAGGQTTIFTASPNVAEGQIIIGYKQGIGGKGASGDGTLFHLVLRAKEKGMARLAIDRLNFRSPTGERLTVTEADTTIEVR